MMRPLWHRPCHPENTCGFHSATLTLNPTAGHSSQPTSNRGHGLGPTSPQSWYLEHAQRVPSTVGKHGHRSSGGTTAHRLMIGVARVPALWLPASFTGVHASLSPPGPPLPRHTGAQPGSGPTPSPSLRSRSFPGPWALAPGPWDRAPTQQRLGPAPPDSCSALPGLSVFPLALAPPLLRSSGG